MMLQKQETKKKQTRGFHALTLCELWQVCVVGHFLTPLFGPASCLVRLRPYHLSICRPAT